MEVLSAVNLLFAGGIENDVGYRFHFFSRTTPHQLLVSSVWVKRMRHRS